MRVFLCLVYLEFLKLIYVFISVFYKEVGGKKDVPEISFTEPKDFFSFLFQTQILRS